MRLQGDYTYTAQLFNDSLNTPELRRPASHNLDAAVHYLPSSDTYELIAGGTNLTNDRYLHDGFDQSGGRPDVRHVQPAETVVRVSARQLRRAVNAEQVTGSPGRASGRESLAQVSAAAGRYP